jgi:hypothetical protein
MRLVNTLVGVGAFLLISAPALAQTPPPRPGQRGPATGPTTTAGGSATLVGAPATAGAPGIGAVGAPGTPAAPGAPGAAAIAGAPGAPSAPGAPVPSVAKPGGPVVAGAPAAPAMDGPTYAVRLRDLEEHIDELKEQIRRSHTRLSLLSDTILSGGGAGSRAGIKFDNELSSAFRVTRVLVVLDGAVQYNKTDQSGALAEQAEIPIFNGSVPPGDHTLQVLVNLQGNGYGVFSYLRGYRFEVRSSHSFTAVEGKTINLEAVAYEKGGVTTPLEERPAIRYVERVVSGLADAPGAGPGASPGPGPGAAPGTTPVAR